MPSLQLTPDNPLRVLVFPGGTEIGLEIAASLRDCKEVLLFSAGSAVPNHAPFVFLHHRVLPDVQTPGWVDDLNLLIESERIDVILPAYDEVIYALAEQTGRLAAPVAGSPPETCRTTRFKSLTYQRLAGAVRTPKSYADPAAVASYPVFVKPDRGQGSQGARVVQTPDELRVEWNRNPGLMIHEYLPGREYTVDCFADRDRGLLFCRGRERIRTKSGIVMTTQLVDRPEFMSWGKAIWQRLPLYGAWFFQVKEAASGELTLLEVGPRVAGGMALNRVLGVNFPLLTLYEHCRMPVTIRPVPVTARMDRALANRFATDLNYEGLYVDLDDTLILRGQVNTKLVRVLYQALNAGKWLGLVTRSRQDPEAILQRWRLRNLFDEVIWLRQSEPKPPFLKRRPAVLIDDSFRERTAAADAGILALDCSSLDLLLDERV